MTMSKRVAVLLSGCGVFDGSEIHESVLTLLALSKRGISYDIIAPNRLQYESIDHLTEVRDQQERNMLSESARIARGEVKNLSFVDADHYCALILPGGFGAAKNLCDFAIKQNVGFSVDKEVRQFIKAFKNNNKPVGFMCIAPLIAADIYSGVKLTIGCDKEIAWLLEQKGAIHSIKKANEVCIDYLNKVVSTPAYMVGETIAEIEIGIDKLVVAVLELMANNKEWELNKDSPAGERKEQIIDNI